MSISTTLGQRGNKWSRSAQVSQRGTQWVAHARRVLYSTALYCTVPYSTVEVKAGNHLIPSPNYLATIRMISLPSKTPFPILTPFQKIPRYLRLSVLRVQCCILGAVFKEANLTLGSNSWSLNTGIQGFGQVSAGFSPGSKLFSTLNAC